MLDILFTTAGTFLFLLYFAGPWLISEKRNCVNKKYIKISSIVAPLLTFPAVIFEQAGWVFYVSTLVLFFIAFFSKSQVG
jgi:hypothetical protein